MNVYVPLVAIDMILSLWWLTVLLLLFNCDAWCLCTWWI